MVRACRWLQPQALRGLASGAVQRRIAIALALLGGLCSSMQMAFAQSQPAAVSDPMLDSIYVLPSRNVRLPSATVAAGSHDAEHEAPDARRFALAGSSALSRASLVEMPADVIPGKYTRPKYALGFRSSAMKNFAQSMGLDAHTCLLPLVRARISLSQDSGTGGRLMVFARCTFY